MKRAVAVAVVCVVVGASTAPAQETTGDIIGTITSADGAPLPGVTVTVVDPARGFERSTFCCPRGTYRLVALQPASYELTASLDGFKTVNRPVRVELGATVTADIQMEVGEFTDTIEVTGAAPLVDVKSTVSGFTASTDELNNRIPVRREATHIALLAPTSVGSDIAFNGDYRGTPGQHVASIGGASAGENLYMVNGLNITNFRSMVGSTFVPFEFLEEVQIKTGGYEAEFGRSMGGVLNMVTKSGTNTVRGHASVYWKPEQMQEQNDDAWIRQNQDEFSRSLEANASLGGAFLRDRLFFFAFVRHDKTEHSEIGGARETVYRNEAPYYGGKLDWNVTARHRLEGTVLVDTTDFDNDRFVWNQEDRTRGEFLGTSIRGRGGTSWILKDTGLLADDVLLTAQYGVNEFERSRGSNADNCPYSYDERVTWTPIGCWVDATLVGGGDDRIAYRIDLDWFYGNHSLRGGIDNEKLTSGYDESYSGGVGYGYFANYLYDEIPEGTDMVYIRDYRNQGSYDTTTTGIYAQDSWAVSPAFTLNVGLRWERYQNSNTEGEPFITIDDQYAPRVGFIWDPSKQGRQKIYGSFGRFHIPIGSNTNIYLAGLVTNRWQEYEVVNQDPVTGLPYDPLTGEPTGLGLLLGDFVLSDGSVPDVETLVASNLVPMSQLEFILGYEQMVGTDWSLGARFVHRRFEQVIEDLTIDDGLAEKYGARSFFHYVLANPGSDFEGFYDLDGDGVNDPISLAAEELGFPKAQRDYYAVELTGNKRFSNNWLLQASYVWSQLYGNHEGYLNSDFGQDNPGLTSNFDLPGLMDNCYGFLPNDRRHNVKVYGAYTWDLGLQVGAFLNWQTGRPINAFATHPYDELASWYGAMSFFEQVTPGPENSIPSPRGSQGTTDDVMALDAMVRYDGQTAGITWNVRMDVFNLFNQQSAIQVYEGSGTDYYGLDAGFLQTTHYQPPRSVRLGFGVSF